MVKYSSPFRRDKNIGIYYNIEMDRLKPGEWICFYDADAVFTTPDFGNQIEDCIMRYPACGFFPAKTNRVMCKWQLMDQLAWKSDDMNYHREQGKELQKYWDKCEDHTEDQLMSGFLMLIKKETWKKVGGFSEDGILGIDCKFHQSIIDHKEKLYLMKGVYLYHWYRGGDPQNKSHLQ